MTGDGPSVADTDELMEKLELYRKGLATLEEINEAARKVCKDMEEAQLAPIPAADLGRIDAVIRHRLTARHSTVACYAAGAAANGVSKEEWRKTIFRIAAFYNSLLEYSSGALRDDLIEAGIWPEEWLEADES